MITALFDAALTLAYDLHRDRDGTRLYCRTLSDAFVQALPGSLVDRLDRANRGFGG